MRGKGHIQCLWFSVSSHWANVLKHSSGNVSGNVPAIFPPDGRRQNIHSVSFSLPPRKIHGGSGGGGSREEEEKPKQRHSPPKKAPFGSWWLPSTLSSEWQCVHEYFIHNGRRGHQVF